MKIRIAVASTNTPADLSKVAALDIFLVERSFEGLEIGRSIEKMGVWALPTSEVSFIDCFVPDTHRLSRDEGDGESHLHKLLAEIRIITGAMALGAGRALENYEIMRRSLPIVPD